MTTISAAAFGFGAGQTGITNRDAINNALSYVESLGGGVVTLPAGTFNLFDGQFSYANYPGANGLANFPDSGPNNIWNNSILLPSNCTLRGSGREATKLVAVANSNSYFILPKNYRTSPPETFYATYNSCIEDLTIDGNSSNQINVPVEQYGNVTIYSGGVVSGIRLRCNKGVVRNVGVTNMVWDGIIFETSDMPLVENCYTYANKKDGIYFSACTDIQALGNLSYDNAFFGIAVANCQGGTVTGNTATRNIYGGIGFSRFTKRIDVIGNNCALNRGHGIAATLDGYPNETGICESVISGNDCSYSGRTTINGTIYERKGIFLVRSDDNLIADNRVAFTGASGIHLINSNRNTVNSNKIYGTGRYSGSGERFGIQITTWDAGDVCKDNTLSMNDIDDDSVSPTTVHSIYANAGVTGLVGLYNVLGNASSSNINVPSSSRQIAWMKSQNRLLVINADLVAPAAPTLQVVSGQSGAITNVSSSTKAPTLETITYWLTFTFTPSAATTPYTAFVLNGLPTGQYVLQSVDCGAVNLNTGVPISAAYRLNDGTVYLQIANTNPLEVHVTVKMALNNS